VIRALRVCSLSGALLLGAPLLSPALHAQPRLGQQTPGQQTPGQPSDRPAIMPQRDVDVTYGLAQPIAGQPPLSQRMRWSVATGRLRVDPPAHDMYMVVDYRARRMMVVRPSDQAVLDMDAAGAGMPGAPSDGRYARKNTDIVAGLACTNWQMLDAGGQPAVLCLTADGVMLRASRDGAVLLEATSVQYTPQDPAAFETPAGFHHIQSPTPSRQP
jgi:hypothetical protein